MQQWTRWTVTCVLLGLVAIGCDKKTDSDKTDTVASADADTADASSSDDADTASSGDGAPLDTDVLDFELLVQDVIDCPGGTGCVCAADGDCTSGFCVETVAGLRCAPLCVSNCAPGFACRSADGEPVNYCAPLGVRECAPCESNSDCNGAGAVPSACVKAGNAGSFCATVCDVTADCPDGSVCGLVAGQSGKVCVPDVGLAQCGCSEWAKNTGAKTRCTLPDGSLACPGTRSCGPAGLTACELVAGEVCIDVGCAEAADGVVCDDGDPCTADSKCKAGTCAGGVDVCECQKSEDCAGKEDGNLCNGTLYCDLASNTCKVNPATVVTCQKPDKSCDIATCAAATGECSVQALPDNTACDDGKACTVGDFCNDGACVSGTVTCTCTNNSDCLAYEDGNQCNGTLFCNKVKGQCQVNPATVVVCPTGLDSTCLQTVCEPTSGNCGLSEAPTTTLCEDGNPCTASDHCDGGSCVSELDICPCSKDADCASKEDNNLCNGTLYCDLASNTCQINPKTVVTCAEVSNNPCSPIECNPQSGQCQASPLLSGSCDDKDACTAPGTCVAGQCKTGPNLCQCQTATDCESFDDGNACNGVYYCDTKVGQCKVNTATIVTCLPGNNSCQTNQCNPQSGKCELLVATDGAVCEDGIPCTSSDTCVGGSCKSGASACGCLLDSDCAGNDDGNVCNGTWYCDKGEGKFLCAFNPNSVVQCNQGGLGDCEQRTCTPATGQCETSNKPGSCEDGNACTVGDTCTDMACAAGLPLSCGTDTVCTDYECSPTTGCTTTFSTAPCNDNNACTKSDTCVEGSCSGAGQLICTEDDLPCTLIVCTANKGCTMLIPSPTCSDGNACTGGDACNSDTGICESGPAVNCDDSNVCTADSCDTAAGCKNVAIKNTCDDNDLCTKNDSCVGSTCQGVADDCDDGEFCTLDSCSGQTGCFHVDSDNNCDDGNACTLGDKCTGGTCESGPGLLDCTDYSVCSDDVCTPELGCEHLYMLEPCKTTTECSKGTCDGKWCIVADGPCSDNDVCTWDSCDDVTGCSHSNNPFSVPCDDTTPCQVDGVCLQGSCAGAPMNCDDDNDCTNDSCDPLTNACRITNRSDGSTCDDDNTCTTGDACSDGVCGSLDTLANSEVSLDNPAANDLIDTIVPIGTDDYLIARNQNDGGATSQDTLLMRQTAGVVVWQQLLQTEGTDAIHQGLLAYGKVWLAGETRSGSGDNQGLLAVFDPTVNTLVQYQYGDTGDDMLFGIAKTSSGIAMAGSKSVSGLGTDGWLLVVTVDGTTTLDKTYGGEADERFLSVAVSGSRFGLTGWRFESCCSTNLWFVGTTASGSQTADTEFGNDGYDSGHGIVEVSNGWLIGGGTSSAPFNTQGESDAWLLRVNYLGQLLWQQAYGGGSQEYIDEVRFRRDGNGAVSSVLWAGKTFDEGGSLWVLAVDPNGNQQWSQYFGTNADEGATAIAVTDTGLVVGGYREIFGVKFALLLRSDAFGRDTCLDAGDCINKTLDGCKDANACTMDTCFQGNCTHTVMDNAARCDDGFPCTMNDSCTSGTCTAGPAADYDADGESPVLCGGGDCDDANAMVGAAKLELCDNGTTDNDCDGDVDETCSCPTGWLAVASDNGKVCAADAPVWGTRGGSTAAYFKVDGSGFVVYDKQTKLSWEDTGLTLTQSAAQSYCLGMNVGGFLDWRMPTMTELQTLLDLRRNPTIPQTLENQGYGGCFWSAAYLNGATPTIDLTLGTMTYASPPTDCKTMCVRGGLAPTAETGAFESADAGASLLHNLTGLYWQAVDGLLGGTADYDTAIDYCNSLTTGGRQWRLPQHAELRAMQDYAAPIIPPFQTYQKGIGLSAASYWSMDIGGLPFAWQLDLLDMDFTLAAMNEEARIRCVSGKGGCGDDIDCDIGDGCSGYCDPFTKTCNYSNLPPCDP